VARARYQSRAELGDGLATDQAGPPVRELFSDQVVVVGVEPLGRLQRWGPLLTAGQCEVAAQLLLPVFRTGGGGEAGGDQVEQDSCVQDGVVVGEGVGR